MEIRFVSSLTEEDEDALAPIVLNAIGALLEQFPLAYTLRIETCGKRVHQRHHPRIAPADLAPTPAALHLHAGRRLAAMDPGES